MNSEILAAVIDRVRDLNEYIRELQAIGTAYGPRLTRRGPIAVTSLAGQIIGRDAAENERSRLRTFIRSRGVCHFGGCRLRQGFHEDHLQPLSKGGPDEPYNVAAACPRHNFGKSDTSAALFRLRLIQFPELATCGGYGPNARLVEDVLKECQGRDPRLSFQ